MNMAEVGKKQVAIVGGECTSHESATTYADFRNLAGVFGLSLALALQKRGETYLT